MDRWFQFLTSRATMPLLRVRNCFAVSWRHAIVLWTCSAGLKAVWESSRYDAVVSLSITSLLFMAQSHLTILTTWLGSVWSVLTRMWSHSWVAMVMRLVAAAVPGYFTLLCCHVDVCCRWRWVQTRWTSTSLLQPVFSFMRWLPVDLSRSTHLDHWLTRHQWRLLRPRLHLVLLLRCTPLALTSSRSCFSVIHRPSAWVNASLPVYVPATALLLADYC